MGKKNKKNDFDELREIDRLLGGSSEDSLEIYFDDDDGGSKKKKKKKKDKDKSKSKKDGWSKSNEKDYKESLKELSKKQLRKKAEALGIDLDYVDKDSKKELRKAIMGAVKNSKRAESIRADKPKTETSAGLEVTSTKLSTKPPFYFDEDTHDFVIGNAMDAEDMTVFQSMQSLGKMRQSKRADDGFGELMDRITKKLLDMPLEKETVIDVEYKVVDDTPTAEQMKDMVEAIELTPEEVEKVKNDVDAALATLHKTRNAQAGLPAPKNRSKKKKH